jgi:hypothetical protein
MQEVSVVKKFALSAQRTPSDKSAGYVTAPAKAGFAAQKPTRSDGLFRVKLRSPAIYREAVWLNTSMVFNY